MVKLRDGQKKWSMEACSSTWEADDPQNQEGVNPSSGVLHGRAPNPPRPNTRLTLGVCVASPLPGETRRIKGKGLLSYFDRLPEFVSSICKRHMEAVNLSTFLTATFFVKYAHRARGRKLIVVRNAERVVNAYSANPTHFFRHVKLTPRIPGKDWNFARGGCASARGGACAFPHPPEEEAQRKTTRQKERERRRKEQLSREKGQKDVHHGLNGAPPLQRRSAEALNNVKILRRRRELQNKAARNREDGDCSAQRRRREGTASSRR